MLDSVYDAFVFGYVLYRRLLGSGQLDGVIVALVAGGEPLLQRLQESHRPCAVVGHHPNHPDIPWLDVDNVAGAKSMTEHLINLGHRRIATITGPLMVVRGSTRPLGPAT